VQKKSCIAGNYPPVFGIDFGAKGDTVCGAVGYRDNQACHFQQIQGLLHPCVTGLNCRPFIDKFALRLMHHRFKNFVQNQSGHPCSVFGEVIPECSYNILKYFPAANSIGF